MEKQSSTNKYGLSRTIPEGVKRELRQKYGFGCVICGAGIITYEHVDPEFHEAKSHDPEKMTLLCYGCHGKVSSKMWSKEKVKDAMGKPKALSLGFSKELFDIGNGHPRIIIASSVMTKCQIPICIRGTPVFEIKPSTEGNFFLLSGNFYDSQGNYTLKIVDNEWFATSYNWDIEVVGKTITIREGLGKIVLQLTASPPDALIVNKIDMFLNGLIVKGNENTFSCINRQTGRETNYLGCIYHNCTIGFNFY